jgi:NAD(P)-dependent dehydrogenase (short-subunit alcohol dehydrogenase family)
MSPETKVVVITGAGSGIGRALAVKFAQEGAAVACFGRHAESLEETARAAQGGRVISEAGSVTSEQDVERLVARTMGAFGRIDVLINNAAVYPKAMLADCPPREWLSTIEINVIGPLICYQKILPIMLEQGCGRIINMGSFAGQGVLPGRSAYSASKAALRSLSKAMALEIDRSRYPNVLVNELVPGAIRTRMSETGDEADGVYPYVKSIINLPSGGPHGRIFLKHELFEENAGIKAKLKRKLAKLLGRKPY